MGFPGLLLPSSDAVGACDILCPALITFSFSSSPATYFIFFIFLPCDVKNSHLLNVHSSMSLSDPAATTGLSSPFLFLKFCFLFIIYLLVIF